MKIEKIYVGGWFQRTMLQLTEIYDFLRYASSRLELDEQKLWVLRNDLNLKEVNYEIEGFEFIKFSTTEGINLKIFEDGLIVLNADSTEETLFNNIEALTTYYETKLSPALSYLFSLGAPIPKELSNIKTVYPYFIVMKNTTKNKIMELLNKTDEKKKYYEFSNGNIDIIRSDKYHFINNKTKSNEQVERYIEEQIFIREFKGQLHHYLNLHRVIWERIAEVKERGKIKGTDIGSFKNKIDGYAKTINLVDARINQMGTFLHTRERITKNDDSLKDFLGIMEYRYETLGGTLSYIQQIWTMTKNYVNSALDLFTSLQAKSSQNSVKDLTVITSMGVGASLIGLFTATKAPELTFFGVIYFFILAAIGYSSNKIMKTINKNKEYKISEVKYDKDIK